MAVWSHDSSSTLSSWSRQQTRQGPTVGSLPILFYHLSFSQPLKNYKWEIMKPECTHNSQVQRIWKVLEFPFTSSSFISQFAALPSSPALITAPFLGDILCLSLYLSFPSSTLISIRQSFSSLASFTGSHLRGFYSENLCCLCLRNAQYVSFNMYHPNRKR